MKSALLVVLYLSLTTNKPDDIPCWKVNGYIWLHGYDKAYAWAAARYNKSQIEAVMARCKISRNG